MQKFARFISFMILSLMMLTTLVACGPPRLEKLVNVQPNETVFVVPLEAKTNAQGMFMSIEYLEKHKIAAKRISLDQRMLKTGRMWYDYKWISTDRVIAVDRTPVTREWTADKNTGTTNHDQAIWVQSLDSIDFGVGISITASVEEKDTARFLYYYAGKPLSYVIDTNVRSFLTSILSREFGALPLGNVQKLVDMEKAQGKNVTDATAQTCFTQRAVIIQNAFKEACAYFKNYGITINTLGGSEGFYFKDKDIRDSINATFTTAMKIQEEENNNEAQDKINARNVAMAKADRDAAEAFAQASAARTAQVSLEIKKMDAQAHLIWAKKWDGNLPKNILPDNSNLLLTPQK